MNWNEIKKFIRFHITNSRIGTIVFNAKDIHEPITKSIDNLTKTFQGKRNEVVNPEAISDPIVEAQKATTEAVKAIPKVDIPKTDLSTLEAKLEALLVALNKKEMTVNVGKTELDSKGIIKAIKEIEFPKMEKQEVIDYTLMLDEMMKILEKPQDQKEIIKLQELIKRLGTSSDLEVISEWLKVISEKEYPDFPELKKDKNGRLLVNVDKVGGGGKGGLTDVESDALKNVATNQLSQLMVRVATNSGDSSITYVGKAAIGSASSGAVWQITKYDDSVDEIAKFAGGGAYNQIWDSRESLSYS